ncbi:undecaprenyl/decaprenyl-phosphate alpha-N-acetylglucosaminyl 1-phosphate transferase [Pseudomonadales bacterium]|nr:undecaprenyl/decaprenyl-phosphate alpha-N-acetylglucosaminyl 1-phosphate transferase [Pseudomonadales bacterium]
MIIAISFALALFLSFVLVPLASRYANALGLMDAPDERKVHSQAIPRAGGIAIVIAFFVPALFWLSDIASLLGFFSGAAIIAVFGFLDDRHNLNYKWKFLGQILGVAIFLASNIEITKTPFLGLGDLLPWVSYPVMAIFILGVINAVNLSDGLDGLAAGSSLLSLGFIALLGYGAAEYTIAIIAVSAMGALTGFLRFNTHPATIFMGDTGSQFLGYVTGCLAIMLTQAASLAVSPVLAILIVGLPILDTFLVMVLRLYAGESPFKPDKQHLHHQLLSKGLMHYQAVGAIYLLSFSLLACAYVVRYQSDWVVLGAYLAFSTLFLGFLYFYHHRSGSQQLISDEVDPAQSRRNPLFRQLSWFHKHGALLIQMTLGLTWVLFTLSGTNSDSGVVFVASLGILMLLIYCFKYSCENRLIARIAFYSASCLAVYMAVYNIQIDVPSWRALNVLDIPIIVLVMLLGVVIRTTRAEHFSMDTQDILVLLVLLASPILAATSDDHQTIIGAIVRLAVFLYAVEYLIARHYRPKVSGMFAFIVFIIYLAGFLFR